MADNAYAAPRVFVDVYPYEGGQYSLSGNTPYMQVTTSKSIANGGAGSFTIELAPSGPFGPSARPSWADVFTPFSLVVIGMRRGSYSQIVMVGVVTNTTQAMQRGPDKVSQGLKIEGEDFTRFFNIFSYFDLTYMLSLRSGATGLKQAILGGVNTALSGTPSQVGATWLNQIMIGPQGLMADTTVNYSGNKAALNQVIASWFEDYPGSASIPTLASFITEDGSWLTKFLSFFPSYFYEFFINTAPVNYYNTSHKAASYTYSGNATAAPLTFTMDGFTPVSPTVVARVNPLPFLTATGSQTNPAFNMDLGRWNALQNFSLDNNRGVFAQELAYTESLIKNFYVLDTTYLSTKYGSSNGSVSPFQLQFSQWLDSASINRYGFRPSNTTVRWFCDDNGSAAVANQNDPEAYNNLVTNLSLRPVSYHEPTPFMMFGTVQIELRPDIMPGCRFTYAPFRDGILWTFSIETVQHSVQFGGRAVTMLGLSRGLPTGEYGYSSPQFLVAIHTGNAQRINGTIEVGLPAGSAALTPINNATRMAVLDQTSPFFAARD